MKIICKTPPGRTFERLYVFETLLGEWLGLDWEHVTVEADHVSLQLSGDEGELRLPDVFFKTADLGWLNEESLPRLPLAIWDTNALSADLEITFPRIPIIYGEDPLSYSRETTAMILPIDIFGSAFFMLSRYEEVAIQTRDIHDRFPARASIAMREGFLDRPIIDEYLEILWSAMQRIWPGLRRRASVYEVSVSHDVDRPARYAFGGVGQFMRRVVVDTLRQRKISTIVSASSARFGSRRKLHCADPANTFDLLMDQSERHGLRSAFYFIPDRTNPAYDADYDIGHPAIVELMRRIHARGHEIGLHPSYDTYLNPDAIVAQANRLRAVAASVGIDQQAWGGRMHYLRFRNPETLQGWEKAGMTYDSTLSYADRAGFRCGTCREYRAFDLQNSAQMKLRIRPLIVMEGTVMGGGYMGLGTGEKAYAAIVDLKNKCRRMRGRFSLLWHNNELDTDEKRRLYYAVLAD